MGRSCSVLTRAAARCLCCATRACSSTAGRSSRRAAARASRQTAGSSQWVSAACFGCARTRPVLRGASPAVQLGARGCVTLDAGRERGGRGAGVFVQVWRTPTRAKRVAPMELHRKYGGCFDTIADICWSDDGQWLAVASEDITARVFSLHPVPGAARGGNDKRTRACAVLCPEAVGMTNAPCRFPQTLRRTRCPAHA